MKFDLLYETTELYDDISYHTVLLIERDEELVERFLAEASKSGIPVIHSPNAEQAMAIWQQSPGLVAVLDEAYLLAPPASMEHLTVEGDAHRYPYVVLAQEPDYKRAVSYLKAGALDYLVKDPDIAEFLPGLLRKLMNRLNTERELHWSQQALLKNEMELRRITDTIEDVILKLDSDFHCTYVSKSFRKVFGMPTEQLLENTLFSLIHGDDCDLVKQHLLDVIETRNVGKFEFRMRTEGGHYLWTEAFGTPLRLDEGPLYGVILTLRDITHRKMIDRQLREERKFISNVLEAVGSLIAVLTEEGRILRYNRACEQLTGIPEDAAVGRVFWDVLSDEREKRSFNKAFNQVLAGCDTGEIDARLQTRDGETRVIRMVLTQIPPETGDCPCVICTGMDITSRIRDEQLLKESEERWQFALEGSGDGVRDWDFTSGTMLLSAQWRKMLGAPDMKAELRMEEWLDMISEEDREMVMNQLQEHLCGESRDYEAEYRIRCGDGTYKWILDRGKVMRRRQDGTPLRMVCTQTDITNRKIIEAEIRYMSFHDKLTGLYNRFYFEEELNRLDTARQLPLSIIVGDVNGLKLINDAFGHEEGDRLIQAAATVLRHSCRTDDIIARIGGDEFSILLPGTDSEAAMEVVRRIREHSVALRHEPIQISIAVGVATKSNPNEDLKKVFKLADDRMYKNKLVESKSLKSAIITSLKKTLQERTQELGEHSDRLKNLALRLGGRLGFSTADLDDLELLSLLHDIGKIAIPDHILNKPDKLTPEEWDIMRQHSEIGYRIASTTPELSNIAEYILSHHEWVNGSGYPQGLSGEDIPVVARVLAVVDAYDAMISNRRYRAAKSKDEALRELARFANQQFDETITHEFIRMIREEDTVRQIC